MRQLSVVVTLAFLATSVQAETRVVSHPPLRTAPPPASRPLTKGPAYFVDARQGDDSHDGAKAAPWRTLAHALKQLKAGDTLYLRGGVYYENVYVALAGKKDLPITLASYPGEQAILDGGLREFFEAPQTAWQPYADGGEGEYRSSQRYPNIRDILGSFGDSMVGLQTYFHAVDLRAKNELVDWENWEQQAKSDVKPLYCGPGMWYDVATGYIHVRLAHTHLPEPIANYRGPTDPRQLPLVLTPFQSTTLHIDHARHLRLRGLVIRGGGYATIVLNHGVDIEFDNVTVWCGTYGIQAARTGPLKFVRSALHGNVAPWTFRGDGSKRDYPGRPHRNISRLNTHALLELDAGKESSVYATPQNDDWEFAYSEFTDAHDALYFGCINVRFHHNLVENMQDDGIYLSPMYHRYRLLPNDAEIHIYQNVFRQMLTALAFGGPETATRDKVFVYRNLVDLRGLVNTGRPSVKKAEPGFSFGKVIGDHGGPPWSTMYIYHNTVVMREGSRSADMTLLGGLNVDRPRRFFNNILLHHAGLPALKMPDPELGQADGNLYWHPGVDAKKAEAFFTKYRASPLFEKSKKVYPPGFGTNSRVADPQFVKAEADPAAFNDYRLQPGSPAGDAGVELPKEWPDPLRSLDKGKPDVGALPRGVEMFKFGRSGLTGADR